MFKYYIKQTYVVIILTKNDINDKNNKLIINLLYQTI